MIGDAGQLQGRAGLVSRRQNQLASFALIEGQRLQAGDLTLTASAPLTMEGQIAAHGWALELNPHPALEMQLAVPFSPKSIQGLGTADWHYDGRVLTLKLRADVAAIVIRK